MPAASKSVISLQAKVWSGSLPLEIKLAASDCRTYDESETYLVQFPRLSYLAFLLPRLHTFFAADLINPEVSSHDAWFSFEGVPLKWHYPVGLLYDLYSGVEPIDLDVIPGSDDPSSQNTGDTSSAIAPLPWKLAIHYSEIPAEHLLQLDVEGRAMRDTFINNVKEADFIRNGTARTVMSLGKEDSDNLWIAVQDQNLPLFNSVNNKLMNPPGMQLRHVPIKIYIPTSASRAATDTIPEEASTGHIRVVQALVPLLTSIKQPQTLGTALNNILPTIFPSRRSPIYARPVLHGAVVPLAVRIDELGRAAAYTDGFLHVAVVMHG